MKKFLCVMLISMTVIGFSVIAAHAEVMSEYRASVCNDEGKFSYIDENAELVMPFKYSTARNFSDGLAAVSYDGETEGYIDIYGNEVISPRHFHAGNFHEGFALVIKDGLLGPKFVIDKSGNDVFPLIIC